MDNVGLWQGYTFAKCRYKTCFADYDECDDDNKEENNCEDLCSNSQGGYTCKCGYGKEPKVGNDESMCKGRLTFNIACIIAFNYDT